MYYKMPAKAKYLPIGQSAEFLGVSVDTLRRWEKQGKIASKRLDGRNRYFSVGDLEKQKFGDTLNVKQTASRLSISPATLRRISDKGLIKPKRSKNDYRHYLVEDVENYLSSSEHAVEKAKVREIVDTQIQTKTAHDATSAKTLFGLAHQSLKKARSLWRLSIGLITSTAFGLLLIMLIIFALFLCRPKQTAEFFNFKIKSKNEEQAVLGASTQEYKSAVLGATSALFQGPAQTTVRLLRVTNPERVEGIILPGEEVSSELVEIINRDSLKEGDIYFNLGQGNIDSSVVINKSPTITLSGDLAGSTSLSNLASGTLKAEIEENTVGNRELIATDVAAGDYTHSSLTIDANGRITSASSGTDNDTTYSGGNGLTLSGTTNTFALGGTLSESTAISQGNFDLAFNLTGTGDFSVQDNGVNALVVSDSGATDISRLSVNSAFTFPTADGTNGQALLTDGSGAVVWGAAGVSDHGTLAGLTDDDHTQYLLTDGTRTMTGNLSLGSNSLALTGSIASTGSRSAKGWFIDLESTNMPTVGGVALSSTFLQITNNLSDLANIATSRTNLGLGALAVLNDLSTFSTTDLSEGTNLYFTDARVGTYCDTRYLQLTGGTLTGALTLTPTANSTTFQVNQADSTNVLTVDTTNKATIIPDGAKFKLGTGQDGEIYSSGDDLYIKNITLNQDISFNVNDGGVDKQALFIQGSTGNVGIGTTAPSGFAGSGNLDVLGDIKSRSGQYITGGAGDEFVMVDADGNAAWMEVKSLRVSGLIYERVEPAAGNLIIDGNVGIGEISPGAKLQINTGVAATIGLIVKAAASQSANILEIQSSAAAVLAKITPTGGALFSDKVQFTQTDGNEYIDSLNDGYMDYGATIGHRFNNDKLVVLASGGVGIGIDPTLALDVVGNARFSAVGSGALANDIGITADGTLTTDSSDVSMKTNLVTFDNALEKVLGLQSYYYNWVDDPDGSKRIGFIAQEVAPIIPEITFINPTDGKMGINYSKLTPVLAQAIKEQELRITNQELRIEGLEKEESDFIKDGPSEGPSLGEEESDFIKDSPSEGLSLGEIKDSPSEGLSLEGIAYWNYEIWSFIEDVVFKAKVKFENAVTFLADVSFGGKIKVNKDTAGILEIPAGVTKIKVVFDSEFAQVPLVMLTPAASVESDSTSASQREIYYHLEEVTTAGFIVKLSQPQTASTQFTWLALMKEEGDLVVEILEEGSSVDSVMPEASELEVDNNEIIEDFVLESSEELETHPPGENLLEVVRESSASGELVD